MPQITLGQRLKQNKIDEDTLTVAQARIRAQREGAEAVRKLALVEKFFEHAKSHALAQVEAGASKIEIQLGTSTNGASFSEAASLLNLCNDVPPKKPDERLRQKTHPYASSVIAFDQWAAEQELKVDYLYKYDGGGIRSWHVLALTPAA